MDNYYIYVVVKDIELYDSCKTFFGAKRIARRAYRDTGYPVLVYPLCETYLTSGFCRVPYLSFLPFYSLP